MDVEFGKSPEEIPRIALPANAGAVVPWLISRGRPPTPPVLGVSRSLPEDRRWDGAGDQAALSGGRWTSQLPVTRP